MKRNYFLTVVVAVVCLGGSREAPAQPLLDKLEGTLKKGVASDSEKSEETKPTSGGIFLGLTGDDVGEEGRGVKVLAVRTKGPSDQAGIRAGDIITAINRKPIGNLDEMGRALERAKPGDRAEFQIRRAGKSQVLTVILGMRSDEASQPPAAGPQEENPLAKSLFPLPAAGKPLDTPPTPPLDTEEKRPDSSLFPLPREQKPPRKSPSLSPQTEEKEPDLPPAPPALAPADLTPPPAASEAPAVVGKPSLGVTVKDFTPGVDLAAGSTVKYGALLTVVREGSPVGLAGIPVNAVIVAFDGRRVSSADDLVAEVRAAQPGQEVELTYYAGARLRKATVKLAAARPAAPPETTLPETAPPASGARAVPSRVEQPIPGATEPRDEQPPAGVATEVAELKRQIDTMRGQVETLLKQLIELEARLQTLEKSKP
jgi:serine protease Do